MYRFDWASKIIKRKSLFFKTVSSNLRMCRGRFFLTIEYLLLLIREVDGLILAMKKIQVKNLILYLLPQVQQ